VAHVSEPDLIAKLHQYPNLMLWIAGHRHYNAVTAFKSPDPARPEFGFWQVETSSLRDFPQQFRTFEILRNNDDTISILATNVDPAVRQGSPAATSRGYAIAIEQIYSSSKPTGQPKLLRPTGSYNAELVKPLSPEMGKTIRKYGWADSQVEWWPSSNLSGEGFADSHASLKWLVPKSGVLTPDTVF
jgi:hypothetical protein